MAYATDTSVPVEKSRAEIERILSKYGAARFAYMSSDSQAMIAFEAHGKFVKFILPLPNLAMDTFWKCKRYNRETNSYRNSESKARTLWEQACRTRWRALCLCVKAKLEAVECGITSFEQEFLAHFVMPGGGTFGDYAIPKIEEATRTGQMPTMQLLQ